MVLPSSQKRNLVLTVFVATVWLTTIAWAGTQPKADLGIEIKNNRISMDLQGADILQVLREIAEKLQIKLSVPGELKGSVSLSLQDETLETALRKICKSQAITYEYIPASKTFRVIGIGAFNTGSEPGRPEPRDRPPQSSAPAKLQYIEQTDRPKNKKNNIPPADLAAKLDMQGRPLYRPDELLIQLKDGAPQKLVTELHRRTGGQVVGFIDRHNIRKIKLPAGLSPQAAIKIYRASGLVETVERHAIRYLNIIPDDPFFVDQWSMAAIQAPAAWDLAIGSNEVIIAVIDTGINYLHPDLAANIRINEMEFSGEPGDDDNNGYIDDIRGWDFADQDADPMDGDPDGHGTHVAGIIAARGNNGIGIAGVNWTAKLMPLKVLSDNSPDIDNFDVINAVYYAIDNGARIVNCSFGGQSFSQLEKDAFIELGAAGGLAVCAAGNDGVDTDIAGKTEYPAGYQLDHIISVAASDQNDVLAAISNFGAGSVDLMAPGVDVLSTVPAGSNTIANITAYPVGEPYTFLAQEMEYAGTTGADGLTGIIYHCGIGNIGDFPDEVNGNIALIQRKQGEGNPTFADKTTNAQNAGAIAVIIYNDEPGICSTCTLQTPDDDWVPVVSISKAAGEWLRAQGNISVRIADNQAGYSFLTGTSMAAPFVSGTAGLLLSLAPGLTPAGIKAALLESVEPIDSVAGKMVSGGRLNIYQAVQYVLDLLKGDISCDGWIALDDAILAAQVISGAGPVAQLCPDREVNADSRIGLAEMIYILQKISGRRQ